MKSSIIAACGMNCGICRGYLREKKKCPGCKGSNENKTFSCVNCKIKACNELNINKLKFCFESDRFLVKEYDRWIKDIEQIQYEHD